MRSVKKILATALAVAMVTLIQPIHSYRTVFLSML